MADNVIVLPPTSSEHAWMDVGICQGRTHLFFAPHAERPEARARRETKARAICVRCPVLAQCRRHARVHLEYGFWGGESEEERADAGYAVPAPIGGRSRRRREALG
ncbi:WhiB family transcriptional regulator [soil metagenome]